MFISGGSPGTPYESTFSQSVNKTDEDVITLPIQLYAPALVETTVTITASGTARSSVEDYGTGKNYTLSETLDTGTDGYGPYTVDVTILAGKTEPETPVTVSVVNNPIYDIDRVASFSFSNDQSKPMVYSQANITIVDNGADRVYANVKTGYGGYQCVGDWFTDDTVALQGIANAVYAASSVDGNGNKYGGVIYFPAGTYMNSATVSFFDGMTLVSDAGAIIKRKDGWNVEKLWNVGVYNTPYLGDVDSNPFVMKGLILNGNQDAYHDQPHNFQIKANKAGTGRIKVYLDSCSSVDSMADGFSLINNIDLTAYNISTTNSGRQGISFVGGYTVANIRKYTATDGLDLEQTASAVGYGDTLSVALTANDWDVGYLNVVSHLELDGTSIGTTLTGDNITTNTFTLLRNTNFTLADSALVFGGGDVSDCPSGAITDSTINMGTATYGRGASYLVGETYSTTNTHGGSGFTIVVDTITAQGSILTSHVGSGGLNYPQGTYAYVTGGSIPALIYVDTVDGNGAVLTYHYSVATGISFFNYIGSNHLKCILTLTRCDFQITNDPVTYWIGEQINCFHGYASAANPGNESGIVLDDCTFPQSRLNYIYYGGSNNLTIKNCTRSGGLFSTDYLMYITAFSGYQPFAINMENNVINGPMFALNPTLAGDSITFVGSNPVDQSFNIIHRIGGTMSNIALLAGKRTISGAGNPNTLKADGWVGASSADEYHDTDADKWYDATVQTGYDAVETTWVERE
jgi:hypothetical protein